jgi:hypothetical protein
MLVNVESELPEDMLDQASDCKIRKAQKFETLKNFPRCAMIRVVGLQR